jgi:hypothetical protein
MINLGFCTRNQNPNDILQELLEFLHLLEEPDAHVRRDLIIPRPSSM